ncbi:MAG TPA: DUF4349 domain-containing protein [Tepidisphaeraceae bacterium]|nr:DUF4349 domain-containing protein [Tepidisphaeraceae bacterium]
MSTIETEHDRILKQIATYLADGLDEQERAGFESHVATCPSCAAELNGAKQTESHINELFESVAPSADFEDRVLGRLRLSTRFHRKQVMAIIRKAAIAAAGVIVVGGMGFVGQEYLQHGRLPSLSMLKRGEVAAVRGPAPLEDLEGKFLLPSSTASKWYFGGGANTAANWRGWENESRTRQISIATADAPALHSFPAMQPPRNEEFNVRETIATPGGVKSKTEADKDMGVSFGTLNGKKINEFNAYSADQTIDVPRFTPSSELGLSDEKRSNIAVNGSSLTKVAGGSLVAQDESRKSQIAELGTQLDGPKEVALQVSGKEALPALKQDRDDLALLLAQANEPAMQRPTTQSAAGDRRVIREGTMEFEVDSYDSAFATISKVVSEEGGVVAAADSDKLPNGKVRGSVSVRVPPDHLDTLVLKLRSLGELKTQRLGSRDVGKEYTDLEGQLRAARAMEERLLEMIKTANGRVADLLQAERELGTWRTKIETITGQLNYFNNLISMATLTINAYEKDIRTAASAKQTEEINAGVETEDVEVARNAAIKSIDEAKGRIIESTLQKLEAGQFAARIVAELPPENAGQIVDRLKQLGRVARLDSQRHQTETQGTSSLGLQPKIETAPSRVIISMYNLANIAPRLTTNLNLAATDVEATYRAILKRVTDAGGRIITSNLNRQDATQVNGSIQFELKSDQADAVRNDITRELQVLRLAVNDNPDTANVTTTKQAFVVQIIPASQVPPRETRTLAVQTSEVETAMQNLNAAASSAGGRTIESSLSQEAGGASIARLIIEVPLDKLDQVVTTAKQQGTLRSAEASKDSQVPDGPLARARVNLTIATGDTIVPQQGGLWDTIRNGLSTSVKGLLWSLQLMVIGLCLIAPWGLMIWGGWRFARRNRKTKSEG